MGFSFGEAGVIRIEGVGFVDPDILSFYGGNEDGLKTQLIQHVSQLSVVLRAVPKAQPESPPRRIGFTMTPGWQGGESGDGSVYAGFVSPAPCSACKCLRRGYLCQCERAAFSLFKHPSRNHAATQRLIVFHGSAIDGGSMPPAMAARCKHKTVRMRPRDSPRGIGYWR